MKKEAPPSRHETKLRGKIREQLVQHAFHSNRRIAAIVGTSHPTVAKVRAECKEWSRSQIKGRDGIIRRIPARMTMDKEIDRTMTDVSRLFDKANLPEFRQYRDRLISWLREINSKVTVDWFP